MHHNLLEAPSLLLILLMTSHGRTPTQAVASTSASFRADHHHYQH
jgi:hypothetical protein